MNEDNYKKSERTSEGFNSSRDGYKPSANRDNQRAGNSNNRDSRPRYNKIGEGSTERPRTGGFNRGGNSFGSRDGGGYRPRTEGSRDGGGYRPRTEGSRDGGGFRPRTEGSRDGGGYRPRTEGSRDGGGFRPRTEGSRDGGGYRPRTEGSRDGGGFRPRTEGSRDGGGFRSRTEGSRDGGGYRPRTEGSRDGGGFRPRTEGSRDGGGYRSRTEGSRDGGGYRSRTEGSRDGGGFRPRTDGYDPNAKYSAKKRYEYKEANVDPNAPIRLNKFLANAGVCSRRDADKYIQAGVITVNGTVITELGTKIMRTDAVKFHDDTISPEKKVYVILNKPKDFVTTSDDPQNRKTVMDLVGDACSERIYPVGRLDRNTTGVLILTNDGDLASKLTHPKYLKKKIYHVYTEKNVTLRDLQQIAEGIELEDGEIKADRVEYASPTDKKQVGIEIHSGKNRVVRRMFESLGHKVIKLDRVYFAGLTKKNLSRGEWRHLTEQEVNMLRMGAFE